MIQFIILFTLVILLSGVFLNGFYNITRGWWATKPDGTQHWDGMIFKWWTKFLEQSTPTMEFYKNHEFLKRVEKLKQFFTEDDIIEIFDTGVLVAKMDVKKRGLFNSFAAANEISFSIRDYGSGQLISLYEVSKKYVLPFWIRAPLGDCITCISSFWGTIVWLFWVLILGYVQNIYPTPAGTIFIEMPMIGKVGIWIFFCTSLAYVNEILFNLNDRLK